MVNCAQKKSKIKPQTSKTMADVQALTKVLAEHFASMNQTLNEARMSVVVFLFLISLIRCASVLFSQVP